MPTVDVKIQVKKELYSQAIRTIETQLQTSVKVVKNGGARNILDVHFTMDVTEPMMHFGWNFLREDKVGDLIVYCSWYKNLSKRNKFTA